MAKQSVDFRPQSRSRAEVEAMALKYRTWGKWGKDDELGAANFNTPDLIREASKLIRRGVPFSLSLPFGREGPQRGSSSHRVNPQHIMLMTPTDPLLNDGGLQRFTDDAIYMPLQCSTQWDAFCHVFHDGKTYNDRGFDSVSTSGGAKFNSITNFKDRSLGRGVLLDIPRWASRDWLEPGESIQAEHLEQCAAAQGVEVREGDFVLIRTGQIAQIRARGGEWGDYSGGPAPGLGVSAADFLCSRNIVAVSSDTWGLEALPYETKEIMAPLHIILLVNAGVYIGEMWDMEKLAEDCASDRQYEFFVVAQPLPVTGSVGSPLNPIVIK